MDVSRGWLVDARDVLSACQVCGTALRAARFGINPKLSTAFTGACQLLQLFVKPAAGFGQFFQLLPHRGRLPG